MARIVVVGSVAQDEVLELAQPLREGRHLETRRREVRLGGGAANTGLPLRYAGHDVALVSAVGTDEAGEWLLDALRAEGIDTGSVLRVSGESTRSVVLLDPEGERTIVNVNRCRESGPPVRLRDLGADVFYARSREPELAGLLAEAATRALVVAHVPPITPGARPAHILVASESDLPAEFLACPWASGRSVAGEILEWVVLTRGARGAEAVSAKERLAAPAPELGVVDTTGAGDAFAAGLVHTLVGGEAMASALETAVAWGSAAVGTRGIPTREVIRELLRRL